MQERTSHPCDALLQQWSVRRELAHYYFTALLRLSSNDSNAEEQRQEISEKLFVARIALRQVADQLQSCQQEHKQHEWSME
ncbi:MAG: hypothetical protein PVS3B3_09080 [Ktedonobacteraceae bacterium]